jgi:hypothetical protein
MSRELDLARGEGRLISLKEFRNQRGESWIAPTRGRLASLPAESIERCPCPACRGAEKYLAVALKARSRGVRPRADRMRLLAGGKA